MLQPPGRCCACIVVGRCFCQLYLCLWQMLLPYVFVADVCCQDCVADVIATMADGIAIIQYLADVIVIWCVLIWLCGRCYCHYGWWYCHFIWLMWLCGRCYCHGGRWNSLPRWLWIMVRCYNHRWLQKHMVTTSATKQIKLAKTSANNNTGTTSAWWL